MPNKRYKITDVRVAVDLDSPEEVAAIKRVVKRAALFDEAEQELQRELEAENQQASGPAPRKQKRIKKGPPTGTNLQALQQITEDGTIDHNTLVALIFGMPKNEKERLKSRNNLYSRIAHWKQKNWLVEHDGEWIVRPGLLEEVDDEA